MDAQQANACDSSEWTEIDQGGELTTKPSCGSSCDPNESIGREVEDDEDGTRWKEEASECDDNDDDDDDTPNQELRIRVVSCQSSQTGRGLQQPMRQSVNREL